MKLLRGLEQVDHNQDRCCCSREVSNGQGSNGRPGNEWLFQKEQGRCDAVNGRRNRKK